MPLGFALAALACALALSGPSQSANFHDAFEAFSAGKYTQARQQFLALAQLGDGASQFNLGAMAIHGQAGPKDIASGIGWLLAAASNGYQALKPAQLSALESKLTAQQRSVAEGIVARYGHAALTETVLPPPGLGSHCSDVFPATIRQRAPLVYPALLRVQRNDALAVIELTIGVDGLARDPEVLMAVPSTWSPAAAIDAFFKSRFNPAIRDGKPVESKIRLRAVFTIIGGGNLWDVGMLKRVREAADAGDSNAQYLTGLAATLDSTVGISPQRARQLLLAAAQGGQPQAQYLMGLTLESLAPCGGSAKAHIWLDDAAASGDASAEAALAAQLLQGSPSAAAIHRARTLLEQAVHSKRFYVRKHVAALLAASPIAGIRDPSTALAVAKKLAGGMIRSDPQTYDVLAAAYAANRDFSKASSSEQEAISTARALYWNTSLMRQRLAAYRSSRPWLGDLLQVPPASTPPPDLSHTAHPCRGPLEIKAECGRREVPDQPYVPLGSRISR